MVKYVAPGTSGKSTALKTIVKQEFNKNREVRDPAQLQALQSNAVRALSNYLVFQNASSDPKTKMAIQNFHDRNVSSAKQEQRENKRIAAMEKDAMQDK